MIGWFLFIGFLVLIFWYLNHPTPFEKRWAKEDKPNLLDRKARFSLYVRGEQQLMADWECSFSPIVCHRERETYRERQVIQDGIRACREEQSRAFSDTRVSPAEFSVILQRCSAMERASWRLPKLPPSIYVLPSEEEAA